jgi:5'-nucleotidase
MCNDLILRSQPLLLLLVLFLSGHCGIFVSAVGAPTRSNSSIPSSCCSSFSIGTSMADPATTPTAAVAAPCRLRIIQINDVYELDAFPSLATAIRNLRGGGGDGTDNNDAAAADATVVLLAGDFLAPSLLSSLDQGMSMVDCLNALGITHVCLGNHEADVTITALRQRIQESHFTWVNSNLHGLYDHDPDGRTDPTIPYDIIDVVVGNNNSNNNNTNGDGHDGPPRKRRVALLGLVTHDPALYRPGAFGGATIEPIVDATHRFLTELHPVVDLIVPMTHQGIQQDRDFCTIFHDRFPIVCGGHDHTPYDEVQAGCRILKAGMDATKVIVIDITWDNTDADDATTDVETTKGKPTCMAQMYETASFAPDMAMQQRVHNHQKILHELDRANLFLLSNWAPASTPLSTKDNRTNRVSTGTTALCTMLRMGLRAQCGIINAGAIRGNRVYDITTNEQQKQYFTWSDLKAEIPFTTAMEAVYLPGSVLQATLVYGRTTKRGTGGYLHHCNNIIMTDDDTAIISIQGKPFDAARRYLTALPAQFLEGIDNHRPLLDYAATTPELAPDKLAESAMPAKMILVQVFSSLLWLQMGSFDKIDCNQDGVLSRDEIQRQVDAIYGHETGQLVVDNVMAIADLTGDGTISPLEMMIVQFAATDLLEHACSKEELRVMRQVAHDVLGEKASSEQVHDMVSKIRATLDVSGDGTIRRDEVMQAMGALQHQHMLT